MRASGQAVYPKGSLEETEEDTASEEAERVRPPRAARGHQGGARE